jgi:PTS system, beta-glucoside-specific IIABC subunit
MIIFSCLILEFDIDEIKKAGYVLTTPIIVTNTDEYLDVLEMKKENVEFGDELITIVK